MKNKAKLKFQKSLNKTMSLLAETNKLLDKATHAISLEKLKRETMYMDGDPRRHTQRIYDLERIGYVKIDHKSDSVKFTTKGKIKIIENLPDNSKDGKWRFLSWDIPEEFAPKRQQFCRSIRRIGFRQVQKSLWVCPYVKADQIDYIIDELEIRKFVAYIVAERTDIEKDLDKIFNE